MAQQDNPNDTGIQETEGFVQAGRATVVDQENDFEPNDEGSQDNPENTESDNEKLYAGVYKSVEELEAGYKNLQSEYTRNRQAGNATQTAEAGDTQSTANTPTEVDALREEVASIKFDREWAQLEKKFGDDIRERVTNHFNSMPEEDQAELNTMAGARLIAGMLSKSESKSSAGRQSVGSQRSHRGAGKSKLTRQQIVNMPPDEYKARQPEIQRFYAENYS